MPEFSRSTDQQLSHINNNQQFRNDTESKAQEQYDSNKHRVVYQNTQKSFDEQQKQYTEQAFNEDNFETDDSGTGDNNTASADESNQNIIKTYDYESAISDTVDDEPQEYYQRYINTKFDRLADETENIEEAFQTNDFKATGHYKRKYIKDSDVTSEKINKIYEQKRQLYTRIKEDKKSFNKNKNLNPIRGKNALDNAVKDTITLKRLKNKNDTYARVVRRSIPIGRLKFKKYHKITYKEYEKKQKKHRRMNARLRVEGRLIYSTARDIFNDDNISEDDNISSAKGMLLRGYRTEAVILRHNTQKFKNMYNPYVRLKDLQDKETVIKNTIKRKRMKHLTRMKRVQEEGRFYRRTITQLKMTKKSVEYRARTVRRIMSTVFSAAVVAMMLFLVLIILIVILTAVTEASTDLYSSSVVQVDYSDMSESSAYLRKLETDMDEYLSKRDELEEYLQSIYGPDIYEFIYDIAEFGFNSNTLIAYLAAQYGAFVPSDIFSEIESIFKEMYTLRFEIKMEYRDVPDISVTNPDGSHPTVSELKKICYVILEKKELEDVVEPRLESDKLKQYQAYKLSSGGQQVYGPVMREDWTGKISSNYGERIHPITGVRTFHNGVDIAVPKGTMLYSSVSGTVIIAKYSDSAGNYVRIQTVTGWTVTFMHMDSFVVSQGQKIERGDFVGYSGNTGNSTGPHLHLEVRDADGNTVNPMFIIPQNCYAVGEEGD